jgi:hypothetical protein
MNGCQDHESSGGTALKEKKANSTNAKAAIMVKSRATRGLRATLLTLSIAAVALVNQLERPVLIERL